MLDIDQWSETLMIKDPFDNITTELKKLVAAASNQKAADETLARAADSLNVYLEAGPRVQMARQKRRDEREARMQQFKAREAQLFSASAQATDDPDPSESPDV